MRQTLVILYYYHSLEESEFLQIVLNLGHALAEMIRWSAASMALLQLLEAPKIPLYVVEVHLVCQSRSLLMLLKTLAVSQEMLLFFGTLQVCQPLQPGPPAKDFYLNIIHVHP